MTLLFSIYFTAFFYIIECGFFVPGSKFAYLFLSAGVVFSLLFYIRSNKKNLLNNLTDSPTVNTYNNTSLYNKVLLLVTYIIFICIIPYPYNLSGIFILGALIFSPYLCNPGGSNFFTAIPYALLWQGIISLLMSLITWFYYSISPHWDSVAPVTYIINLILNISGVTSAVSQDGQLCIPNNLNYFSIITTESKLWIHFVMLLMPGIIILILTSENIIKNLFRTLLITCLFIIFRYLLILALIIDTAKMSYISQIYLNCATFGILPLLLSFLNRQNSHTQKFSLIIKKILTQKIDFKTYVIFTIIIFLITFSASLYDPGHQLYLDPSQNTILIDESHSDWEWTDKAPDQTEFSTKSMYNYYAYRNYLSHFFDVQVTSDSLINRKKADCDQIIIKTPTSAYTDYEIQWLLQFVKRGGGLILIGDHTNVFGTSTYLNPILEHFGMELQFDSTYDYLSGAYSTYKPPKLLAHPIVYDIPVFSFLTSCSLKSSSMNDNVITGYSIKKMFGDYGRNSFFPKMTGQTDYDFGLFNQMSTSYYGRGRVVVFTDSTIFSNFSFYDPYKYKLALNISRWASKKNSYENMRRIVLWILIALFAVYIYYSRKKISGSLSVIVLSCILAVPSGLYFANQITKLAYPPMNPVRKFDYVIFDKEHSNFYLPIDKTKPFDIEKNDFQDFYANVLRFNYVPSVRFQLSEFSKQTPMLLVFINPEKKFSDAEKNEIKNYVNDGGAMLLMDDPDHESSTSNELLALFNMKLQGVVDEVELSLNKEGDKMTIKNCINIMQGNENRGCQPLLTHFGKGKILVFGKSSIFSKGYLGNFEDKERVVRELKDSYLFLQRFQMQIYRSLLDDERE